MLIDMKPNTILHMSDTLPTIPVDNRIYFKNGVGYCTCGIKYTMDSLDQDIFFEYKCHCGRILTIATR